MARNFAQLAWPPPLALAAAALWLASAGCGAKTPLGTPDAGARPDSSPPPPPVMDAGRDVAPPPPPPVDAGTDAGPEDAGPRPCRVVAPVDLLLVVDDSRSMQEEQIHLADQLPLLVEGLVDPPDADGDGRRDWKPIRDLHLGVVTTGVADGAGTCPGVDDGRLRDSPDPDLEGCDASYPTFLTFGAGDDPDAVSEDFACIARAGIDGCPVEQPLEASLKALTPVGELGFVSGAGRGDEHNAGFLRELSMLAVLVLTDEDDCSYEEPGFLRDWEPGELPPCTREDDPLFPIERYVDGLRALRTDRPDLFAFAAIAGIPESVVDDATDVDFEEVLDHPMMQYRLFPRDPTRGLVPACEGPRGRGLPSRRLVRLAQRFGGQSALGSICQESYTPVVGQIARLVGTRACEEFE